VAFGVPVSVAPGVGVSLCGPPRRQVFVGHSGVPLLGLQVLPPPQH
jgi:hypothetical protein